MKNVLIFLRFATTAFVICLIYDFISNRKLVVTKQQVLASVIIAVVLGIVFTVFYFSKTYMASNQNVDLEKLKIELRKNGFKLIKETATYLCFRGNISYLFYVGDIKVNICEKEIKMSGTRFILDKITKSI